MQRKTIMSNDNLKQKLNVFKIPFTKETRDKLAFLGIAIAIGTVPFFFSNPLYYEIAQIIFIDAILLLGANLIFLKTKELAFGQLALFSVGAYAVAIFEQYEWEYHSLFFIVGLLVLFFLILFLFTFPFFLFKRYGFVTILSLLFSILVYESIEDLSEWTGGRIGLTLDSLVLFDHPIESENIWYSFYAIFLICSLFLLGVARHYWHWPCRKAWEKTLIFSLSSVSALALGCFYAYQAGSITPADVNFDKSLQLLAISALAGLESIFTVVFMSVIIVSTLQFVKINTQYLSLLLIALMLFGVAIRYSLTRIKQRLNNRTRYSK